jgi:hypothetical protein
LTAEMRLLFENRWMTILILAKCLRTLWTLQQVKISRVLRAAFSRCKWPFQRETCVSCFVFDDLFRHSQRVGNSKSQVPRASPFHILLVCFSFSESPDHGPVHFCSAVVSISMSLNRIYVKTMRNIR